MKTKTIILYDFDELTPEAQEKAVNNLSDINVNHRWWDDTYNDAEAIGLKITGFSLYVKATGKLILPLLDCLKLIITNHGPDCQTHKTAQTYLDNYDYCCACDETEDEFLQSILKDYSAILQKEYEYLISREAIIKTINENKYTFTENGKLESAN